MQDQKGTHVGEGVSSKICTEPSFIDFGSIMVQKEKIEKLIVINKSNCYLPINLSIGACLSPNFHRQIFS